MFGLFSRVSTSVTTGSTSTNPPKMPEAPTTQPLSQYGFFGAAAGQQAVADLSKGRRQTEAFLKAAAATSAAASKPASGK